ncbi:MAG: class II fructose-bisphosphate aldolase family protein [Chloroflexi bacterium]|nr:class II fructose-bisphosphate aldolase family protein [Chloroflexota bacterium]
MTLQNIYPWILRAQKEGWAVGAFNANTLEQVQSIVLAAQAEQSPAIIQISHRALTHIGSGNEIQGIKYIAAVGKIAADSITAPVSLHLDHGTESEVIQAITLGFTSVMFDGDGLPFEENISITKRLCDMAHSVGVCMEAEVGEVPKPDGKEFNESAIDLTDPDEASQFTRTTGIDTLAVALGSVHGLRAKSVALDLERLLAIRKRVTIPLVLHGSSGVSDNDIKQGISMGLSKVNVATQLAQAFTGAIRDVLNKDGSLVDPRKYMSAGRNAQMEIVRERIRFFGSSGKAK